MTLRKTWVWILAGGLGVVFVALMVVAGAGVYFVTRHIRTDRVSSTDALRSFDDVRRSLAGQAPLYEIDSADRVRLTRPLEALPSSGIRPSHLGVLGWDPDDGRLVKVTLPFWVARLGNKRLQIDHGDRGFALDELDLDVEQLERIGPALVLDFHDADGARVLVWTQ